MRLLAQTVTTGSGSSLQYDPSRIAGLWRQPFGIFFNHCTSVTGPQHKKHKTFDRPTGHPVHSIRARAIGKNGILVPEENAVVHPGRDVGNHRNSNIAPIAVQAANTGETEIERKWL
jgi:hypothetical protein